MNLKNDVELVNTRNELEKLEAHLRGRLNDIGVDSELHEMSMQSLKRMINQLKEEIARYETHQPAR